MSVPLAPANRPVPPVILVEPVVWIGGPTVSGMFKDLVVGSGIEFANRGEHELKGVLGVWRLFAETDQIASQITGGDARLGPSARPGGRDWRPRTGKRVPAAQVPSRTPLSS